MYDGISFGGGSLLPPAPLAPQGERIPWGRSPVPDLTDQLDTLDQAIADPAAASVDGQQVTDKTGADRIALVKFRQEVAATTGTNPQGGKRSGWGGMRPAQAKLPGGI